ncbi:MAG: hypothetical protein AAF497_04030 [Planctomycetota bacterium]
MSISFPKLSASIEREPRTELRQELREFLDHTQERLDRLRTRLKEIERSQRDGSATHVSRGDQA